MNNKKYRVALVGFYQIKGAFSGASEVSQSLYDSLIFKKKLFDLKNPKNLENNFIIKLFNPYVIKPIKILYQLKKVVNYLKKSKNKLLIIEGASWIGYSYLFIKLSKFFLKDLKIFYHGHNVEYEIRKIKNSLLIQYLTKVLEKKVFENSDFPTVVSKNDQNKIMKLYKKNSIIFNNGISKNRLECSAKKIEENFVIFSGNYFFLPNKIAINKLLKIFEKLIRFEKNLKLVLTGSEIPSNIKKKNYIIFKKNLNKKDLNNYLKKSICTILPMQNAPGTKLKVIEGLLNGVTIIGSQPSFKGINLKKINPPFIYKNDKDLLRIALNVVKNKKKYKSFSKKNINFYKKNYLMENILNNFTKNELY